MKLEQLVTFSGRKGPLLLVVADGLGIAKPGPSNAVSVANTPVIDQLLASSYKTELHAHGTYVGMPSNADMGNSEVGHNTLGGGRVFAQGAKLVEEAMASGSLFEGDVWSNVIQRGTDGSTVHFIGLLSDGNVHSHIAHLLQLIDQCVEQNVKLGRIHALLDGRDVDPQSALIYLQQLEEHLDKVNASGDFDYRIASGGGRMNITMDRYEADWEMVKRGYDNHVHGVGTETSSAIQFVEKTYQESPDIVDQNIPPFVVTDNNSAVGKMTDGDAVVFFNFRGDRGIEISQAFENDNFDKFDLGTAPDLYYCGMLQYDGDLNVPKNYLVDPPQIDRTMVEFMCAEGLKTFAISETQKFGHVTYFWNGNKSGYINEELETYIQVPSDNIDFSQAPAMKAFEITEETIKLMRTGEYRFGRINFANGDMVGHTGDVEATAQSLEAVDECLGQLIEVINELDGILIFTADHGNADEMFIEKDGERIGRTSHTLNPVPFVIVDSANQRDYQMNAIENASLANVAATVFNLMGYHPPEDYFPSLITIPTEPRTRRSLYNGVIVNLGLETVRLPNDELLAMELVRHPGGAVIMAINDQEEVCLIKQFRHAANGWIWEFPAGILEKFETAESTAKRELLEEAGVSADQWQSLGTTLSTPGFCTETLHLFLAKGITVTESAPEKHEFIEIHWLPLSKVAEMASRGDINDAKTIVTLFRALRTLYE